MTAYRVFFNRQRKTNAFAGGNTTLYTKAQAEEQTKLGKEAIVLTAPLVEVDSLEVTAESAEAAVTGVRRGLGGVDSEGEVWVATAANVESKSGR